MANISLIRQFSGHSDASNTNDNDEIFPLDIVDADDVSNYENMSEMVKQQLLQMGYAKLDNLEMEVVATKCRLLIFGYVRLNYSGKRMMLWPSEITDLFCDFYPDVHLFCWNNKYLSLQSSEEDSPNIYVIKKQCIVLSEYLGSHRNDNTEIVRLTDVRYNILELVVRYLVHHKGTKPDIIPKPIPSVKMEDFVADQFDVDFVNKMNQETLFEVITTANYMAIQPLLDLCCAKVATLIKGKSPEEIRQTFHIQNDFSPEEEEAIRSENKWADEP